MAGAAPIRAWKPEGPGLSDSKNWLFGEAMISLGDSLFVPMISQGVIEMDVRTMAVKRVMTLPIRGFNFIEGISCNKTSMMMNIKDRLFTCPLAGDGKSWTEILTPGVTQEDALTWCVRGFDDEFFVGSCINNFDVKSPRILAGMARNGKLTWLASSDRRPALNPLDEMNPRSALLAYRNVAGKTLVLMTQWNGRTPLVELESGREVSSVASHGVAQMRGEIPLYWNFGNNPTEEGIRYLFAFDPRQERPRLLFKSVRGERDLSAEWKKIRPVHDAARPEFQGEIISAVVHGGYLWLLKRQPAEPTSEGNDPNAFRLVRAGLDRGEAVTIPLRYEVPEAIRKLANTGDKQANLERPSINILSLTDTSKGLFFASSGNANVAWSGGRANGGDLAPVLLYVTWDEINAWLARTSPKSAKPASP